MSESAYPLAWPVGWKRTANYARKTGNFKRSGSALSVTQAVDRVIDELRMFGVPDHEAIVSTNVPVNRWGLPASGQRQPDDPGAAVYWRDRNSRRVMAIDRYDKVSSNLAAIAATLDAMRAIERHGGAVILDRAFAGFVALPAPGQSSRSWRDVLEYGNAPPVASEIDMHFRILAKTAHPDRGGTDDAMSALNEAREQAMRELRGEA